MTQATQMIQNPPLISPHQKIDIIVGATLAVALERGSRSPWKACGHPGRPRGRLGSNSPHNSAFLHSMPIGVPRGRQASLITYYPPKCTGSAHHHPPILQKQHTINPHLTTAAQVTYHIPVQSRLVDPARLRIARTQGQVPRTTHLLIKKRIPGAAKHTRVIPKSKLAQVTRSRVQLQHLLQEIPPLPRIRLNHLSLAQYQPYPLDSMTLKRRRHIKLDHPIRTILNRPRKKLTAWEIALAVAIDEHAILNRKPQVRTLSQNMHPFMPRKPVHQALLLYRNFFPARNRICIVQETHIKHKFLKVTQRHLSILGIACRWIKRRSPAIRPLLLAPAQHPRNIRRRLPSPGDTSWLNPAHRLCIALRPNRELRINMFRHRM